MRSDVVVFLEPNIDRDLRLTDGMKPFCVQDLTAYRAVKPLIISIRQGNAPQEPFLIFLIPMVSLGKSGSA